MQKLKFNKKIFLKKVSVIFLNIILLSSISSFQFANAVSFSFSSVIDLSNDAASDSLPQIAVSGNNVYVVFKKATGNDIYFTNSTDGGTSFDSAVNLSQSGGTNSDLPQISISGNNIYVTWKEGSTVVVGRSTDNGDTPPSLTTTLSSGTADSPQIEATGNNVYIAFQDGTDIILSTSTNSGSSYTSDNLSNSVQNSLTPQLATTGSDAYVVWVENNDIKLVKVSNDGATVGSVQSISSSGSSPSSDEPDVAASGNNVYVIWQEGTDIFVSNSTNAASSFGTATDIGNAGSVTATKPQIALVGNNAFAVWRDNSSGNDEIMFSRSISGDAFSAPVNLSNNAGSSIKPTIAASGSNIYVAWRDATSGNNDIIFRGSDDNGATLSSSLVISPTGPSGSSDEPKVAISGTNAFVVFEDNVNGGDDDILFTKGTLSSITISFDKSPADYKLSETATITITDATQSGNGSILATVTSSTGDTTGFSFTLTETGPSTGIFTGSITFSEVLNSDSSIKRLKANPGDIITINYSATQATANIFSRTIDFLLEGNGNAFTSFDYGHIVNLRVTDKNSNINSAQAETISVKVNSTRDGTGITLQLSETGPDTNVFGGTSSRLVFMDGSDIPTTSSTINVTSIDNFGENTNPTQIDSMTVSVNSTTTPGGITLTLFENGTNTADFSRELVLSPTTTINNSTIKVSGGDILRVTFSDFTANAIVSPFPNSHGGISVFFPSGDTISATMGNIKKDVTVSDTGGSGGGGGGLVRPGLVVNVLAGASTLGGGGSGPPGPTITLGAVALHDSASEIISMPQEIRNMVLNHDPQIPLEPIADIYEDFNLPLSINENGFALGGYENTLVTQTIESGVPNEFKIVFYTNSEIAHTSLYFNLGPTNTIAGSDTQVLLYKDKPFEIIDPNGNIASATGSINNESDLKRVVTFSIIFSEDMQWSNSDLIIRAWNDNLNSGDTIIYDAIKVLPSEEQTAFEESIPEPEVEQLQSIYIPIWIKNNAAWWSQELIEDSDFVVGIEYLIQNEIITIQDNQVIASSYSSNEIPEWIKNNAGWWSANLITEQEFIDGLQWLISNGIIQVNKT